MTTMNYGGVTITADNGPFQELQTATFYLHEKGFGKTEYIFPSNCMLWVLERTALGDVSPKAVLWGTHNMQFDGAIKL